MKTNEKTARYFSKCRACKKAHVRDFLTLGGNRLPIVVSFQGWDSIWNATLLCACGAPVSRNWKALKGTFSAKHECNAKCLASTGHQCECSCGGKNHGSSVAA